MRRLKRSSTSSRTESRPWTTLTPNVYLAPQISNMTTPIGHTSATGVRNIESKTRLEQRMAIEDTT